MQVEAARIHVMPLRRRVFILTVLALLWLGWVCLRPAEPVAPVHEQALPAGAFRLGAHTVTPLQPFHVEARVLGREDYRLDRGAEVSPTDLALGWGPMADPQVLQRFSISQSNRWYHWQVDDEPISREAIETHSANMHFIPGNDAAARALAAVRAGQNIRLRGQLVRVQGDDGFDWLSSLSREDTGEGACELIWLEQLERVD